MILWAVLMVVLFVAMIAGMVYLITRIRKFTFMKKLAGGSKKKATLLSTAVITGAVAFFWLLWGFINAVIILLHLIVFWLVSEGISLSSGKRGVESSSGIMREWWLFFLPSVILVRAGIRPITSGRKPIRSLQIRRLAISGPP